MHRLSFYLALIDNEEDQNKFEVLYEHYKSQMKYKALSILKDQYLAEEALQLVFLYVAKNMHKIKEPISIDTQRLLYLVTTHCAYDIVKRERNIANHNIDLYEVEHVAAKENESVFAGDDLVRALQKVPEEYRNVLLLRHGMDYKPKEIAALLNYTVSKVEKRLSRGRAKFREALQEVRKE